MRNISFALTTAQVVQRQKTVTRRIGWANAQAGEVLRAVKKCQGLKKGEKVEALARIALVTVRRERLDRMLTEPAYGAQEVIHEGFPEMTPRDFVDLFCRHHRILRRDEDETQGWRHCTPSDVVTRLEFVYVRDASTAEPRDR